MLQKQGSFALVKRDLGKRMTMTTLRSWGSDETGRQGFSMVVVLRRMRSALETQNPQNHKVVTR